MDRAIAPTLGREGLGRSDRNLEHYVFGARGRQIANFARHPQLTLQNDCERDKRRGREIMQPVLGAQIYRSRVADNRKGHTAR